MTIGSQVAIHTAAPEALPSGRLVNYTKLESRGPSTDGKPVEPLITPFDALKWRETMFSSDRSFQFWRYAVSHNQLLLRSKKTEYLRTRIDILFKNVSLIHLLPTFRGLNILPCDKAEYPPWLHFEIGLQNLYLVESMDFRGYITAGSVSVHEDQGEYYEPSILLPADLPSM